MLEAIYRNRYGDQRWERRIESRRKRGLTLLWDDAEDLSEPAE
jgi:hypothetical protein